jgi:hypothetical protein
VTAIHAALARPVFLVSTPRSGSTLLFRTLVQSPYACSIGGESHGVFEGIRALHPAARGWHSNRLGAADATPQVVAELARRFADKLVDRDGAPPAPHQRMIEKTPKNALRVPFLAAAFPEATFVYLHRAARPTLSSMIEAWPSGRFRTYPRLPGWTAPLPWSLLLVPGWRGLHGRPLAEIVARQWAATTATLVADLAALPPDQVRTISYEDLLAAPQAEIARLCAALGLAWDRQLADLALSPTTVSPPDPDKWRRHEAELAALAPLFADAEARAGAFVRGPVARD